MTEELKRTEATKKEWRALYEAGNRIYALKPWETFQDTDVIALGATYESADYAAILGGPDNLLGVSIYEGVGGLNDYFLLRLADSFGLDPETAMYSQNMLACYWGEVTELSREQKKRAIDLGYRYDDGKWLYFASFVDGYYPVDPEKAEVIRFTKALERLADAVEEYRKRNIEVQFNRGMMYVFDGEKEICASAPWPMNGYVGRELVAPDGLVEDAMNGEKTENILEIDMRLAGAEIHDEKYKRPVNPRLVCAADAKSGEIILNRVVVPGEDYGYVIAGFITDYILEHGRPKRIKISSGLVESVLNDLCSRCDIDLRRVTELRHLDMYMRRMIGMLKNMEENVKLK